MKKAAISIAVVIIVIMITKVCAQQTGKKFKNPKKITTSNNFNLTLHYSPEQSVAVDPAILGVNTGFTFKDPVDGNPDFISLSKKINPSILRFPGGTVANYYHPGSPGYGFIHDEVYPVKALHPLYKASQEMTENILENFIRLCRQNGSKATYCANLLTGTPEEALSVIRRLKESGVELLGVELGNEFNLMMYRDEFPTPESYINKARTFASAIRQEFPDLKLGVIMGDEAYFSKLRTQRGSFQHQWSLKLASENFYDAVIVHYYPKCNNCSSNYLEDFFQNSWNAIAPNKTNYLDTLATYAQLVFPGKKVWITEWNTGDWNTFDNTYMQAAFTAQFLMRSADANIRYENLFEIVNYHFLGADGLIYKTKGVVPPLSTSGKYAPSASYFAFSFFSHIMTQRGGRMIESKLGQEKPTDELSVFAFAASDSSIFIYYVNSGKDQYTVNFTKVPVVYNIENIQGSALTSAAGKTYFDQLYPANQLSAMKLDKKTYKGTEFKIGSFSIGYIEFKPPGE